MITFFCICELHSQNLSLRNDEISLIAAVEFIVKEFLKSQHSTINLITSDDTFDVKDAVHEILTTSFAGSNLLVRQEAFNTVDVLPGRRRRCSIFVIQDFEDFLLVNSILTRETVWFDGVFMFVFVNGRIAEVEKIFRIMWQKQMFNVFLMFEAADGRVVVETFRPFRPGNCNDTSSITIFDSFEKSLNGSEISFDSMKNLHNCTIRVATSNESEPYVFVDKNPDGSLHLHGRDISLMKTLAELLNFHIEYTFIGGQGYFYKHFHGSFTALQDGIADLAIGDLWLKQNRDEEFDATQPYTCQKIVFIVPKGREYTSFEKFILPFRPRTWFLVIICSLTGCIAIFVVKIQKKSVQSFVFGTGVQHPYLNLLIAFAGGSIVKLPKRNFARFLLMTFLIYSLIIRTVYQASFFQVLRKNQLRPDPKTIQEMIDKEFKFFIYDYIVDSAQDSVNIMRR